MESTYHFDNFFLKLSFIWNLLDGLTLQSLSKESLWSSSLSVSQYDTCHLDNLLHSFIRDQSDLLNWRIVIPLVLVCRWSLSPWLEIETSTKNNFRLAQILFTHSSKSLRHDKIVQYYSNFISRRFIFILDTIGSAEYAETKTKCRQFITWGSEPLSFWSRYYEKRSGHFIRAFFLMEETMINLHW